MPVYATTNAAYYSPTYTYQALAGPPPSSYSSTTVIGQYQVYYNSAGQIVGQVPFAVPTSGGSTGFTYTYISGFAEGCPNCSASAASQAAATQWSASNISLFQNQSVSLQQQLIAQMQAQMNISYNQANAYSYYYYYYTVSYLTGGGGTTTPPPIPSSNNGHVDTSLIIKIACLPTAVTMDSLLTSLLATVNSTQQMQNLRDSAAIRRFEVGFDIKWSLPAGVPVYEVGTYVKNGSTQNVALFYNNFTKAFVHVHPPKNTAGATLVDGPSPRDIFGVYNVWQSGVSRRFVGNFIISGDSLRNEYAIAITDTAAAKTFWASHPLNSIIDTNSNSAQVNNWLGNKKDENTFYGQFFKATKDFIKEGYPKESLEDFANIYMLDKYNMGMKIYKKVLGVFKEMNVTKYTDPQGKEHKRITICQ